MKNSFYTKFVVLFTLIAVLGFLYQPSALAFVGGSVEQGVQSAQGTGQPRDLFGTGGIFTTVANTLLYIVGALSVVMIIYGGLRYVVSGGNSSAVTAAKNTILYAIVGLVISILSYAIINFLLTTLLSSSGGVGGTGTSGNGAGWSNL